MKQTDAAYALCGMHATLTGGERQWRRTGPNRPGRYKTGKSCLHVKRFGDIGIAVPEEPGPRGSRLYAGQLRYDVGFQRRTGPAR